MDATGAALTPDAMDDDMGDQEALERIASGELGSADNDEWMTFLQCLTAVGFCPNEEALWLGWQDGNIQKLSLGGERLSPLYRLHGTQGQRRLSHMMSEAVSHIAVRADGQLVLGIGEHGDFSFWQLTPPTVQQVPGTLLEAEQQARWLPCTPYQPPALVIPPALGAIPGPSGCVQISSPNLETESGRLEALVQLKELMPYLEQQLQRGTVKTGLLGNLLDKRRDGAPEPLYFAFGDGLGRNKSEYDFLSTAINTEGGPALMADILAAFSRWSFAGTLQGSKGEPALSEMAFYLSEDDIRHLPVLAAYFRAVGGGDSVHPYHFSRTLAVIRDAYADTPELAAFMEAVPWPYNDADFTLEEADEYDDWGDDDD